VAALVSVEIRKRLALASSKEISEKGAVGDRSVQPGRLRSTPLERKFCGEQMPVTGEDMFLVLIGDVRTFDGMEFTEVSGIEILDGELYFDIGPMGNDSVTVASESQCGKV
jgi:hypothetical protein